MLIIYLQNKNTKDFNNHVWVSLECDTSEGIWLKEIEWIYLFMKIHKLNWGFDCEVETKISFTKQGKPQKTEQSYI